jgi:hypothetical protein
VAYDYSLPRRFGRDARAFRPTRPRESVNYQFRRCTAPGCNRALRDVRLQAIEEPTLLRLLAFEQDSGLSVGGVSRCVRCGRWFLRLRYSRLPLKMSPGSCLDFERAENQELG